MRTRHIPSKMPNARRSLLPLIHHTMPRAQRRPLALLPHNRRPAIHMPIKRIAEVSQRRSSGIHTPFIVRRRFLRPERHPRRICPLSLQPRHLLILGLFPQPLRHALVPHDHMLIRLHRQALSGQNLRQNLPSRRIFDIPALHSVHQKLRMLFRPKQDLNSLPHDPSLRLQRRHRRLSESSRVRQRLQAVLTSQALIYKRDASAWRAQEQLIVVAM